MSARVGTTPEAIRAALRSYRDGFTLRHADPRFAAAAAAAAPIPGFTSPTELSLLFHAALARPADGEIVEIGSYLGRSTIVLAAAARAAGAPPVVAVDPHTSALGIPGEEVVDTRQQFLDNVGAAGFADHVLLRHMTSAQAAAEWDRGRVRLLFVDGWHSREAVLEDVRAWAPHLGPEPTVIFDDFLSHAGVRRAVRELVADRTIGGERLVVGKMIAFGPKRVIAALPAPPGSRTLARAGDRVLDAAIRGLATHG
jgi:MMP 1-O-methyltransferase